MPPKETKKKKRRRKNNNRTPYAQAWKKETKEKKEGKDEFP